MEKIYRCSVSGDTIPQARVEYLLETNIPPEQWTTVKHSQTKKVQGFFIQPPDMAEGEVDSSTLMIVNKIHNDTVRSIMRQAIEESDPDAVEEETVDQPKED